MEKKSKSLKNGLRVPVTRCRLFWEWFKISLFVVGGGYAIISVANEIFGRRLKWLEEDELIRNLPILSSVPGLIAGNSAVYTGLKTFGRSGALIALLGVALPSFMIFLCLSMAFASVPKDNAVVDGAFLGLRSALSGVIAGTLWRMLFKSKVDVSKGIGVKISPLTPKCRFFLYGSGVLLFAVAALFAAESLFSFLAFGCVSIGGGFPLIPFYFHAFVGPQARLLQLDAVDFSNLMALTQMTPGPVSVNAATFFGYRLNGVIGAAVATAALLTPPYFILSTVLVQLDKWKNSRASRCFVALLKPVSVLLMTVALKKFCELSVWRYAADEGFTLNPLAAFIAVTAAVLFVKGKLPVMALVFISAAAGAMATFISDL